MHPYAARESLAWRPVYDPGFVPISSRLLVPFAVYEELEAMLQANTAAQADNPPPPWPAPAEAPEEVSKDASNEAPDPYEIEVFNPAAVKVALQRAARDNLRKALGRAQDNAGRRRLARGRPLAQLAKDFPNFAEVVDRLTIELALAEALPAQDYRLPPLLLWGAPGSGKTAFAQALAQHLGTPFEKIAGGNLQANFEFVGTARHWTNAAPGRIYNALADQDTANPVLLIDEIDKIGEDDRAPIVPSILDLLEPSAARHYRDEAADLAFDASHLIVLATANTLDGLSAPLLSRLMPIEIALPSATERQRIAQNIWRQLCAAVPDWHCADAVLAALCEEGRDLRALQRDLRYALGRAVLAGRNEVQLEDLPPAAPEKRAGIGFLA